MVLLGVGALALPSATFMIALLAKWLIPAGVLIQSQPMFNFVGLALPFGALLSVFASPMVLLFTRRHHGQVSEGVRLGLYLLSAISLVPLAALMLYVVGLSFL